MQKLFGDWPALLISGLFVPLALAYWPFKDAAYVLAQRPKVVQLHIEFFPSTGVWPSTQRDQNWDIFYPPAFQSDYEPNWAGAADPFFPFMFIRQPGPT